MWYISFSEPENFLGAVITKSADSQQGALIAASMLGCNPGGSGLALPFPGTEEEMEKVGPEWLDRVLTKDEIREFDLTVGGSGELLDGEQLLQEFQIKRETMRLEQDLDLISQGYTYDPHAVRGPSQIMAAGLAAMMEHENVEEGDGMIVMHARNGEPLAMGTDGLPPSGICYLLLAGAYEIARVNDGDFDKMVERIKAEGRPHEEEDYED